MMKWSDFGVGLLFGFFIAFQLVLYAFAFYPPFTNLVDLTVIAYLKDVLGPVVTGFGGAGLGALVAYKFQQRAAAEKEFNDSVGVLRLVKFQLINKLTEIASIKKNSILPFEDAGHRFFSIGPLPESPGIKDQLDSKILNMLADVEAAEAIQELLLGEQRYFACFENFKERNKALYAMRQKIDEAGLNADLNFTFRDMVRAVEAGRILAMYQVTENLLLVLDETIHSLDIALEHLSGALDKKFTIKGAKKIGFEKIEIKLFEKLNPPRFTWKELETFIQEAKAAG